MRRTQVQLDEATYRALKRKAFERGVSMSALLRELLRAEFNPASAPRRLESFRFIGSGLSEQGGLAPISERHDEALAEDLAQ
ncbi:MAG: CopG family transcriptional regulator [Chloroflexota bacterium]|nr:CopG family transcriptional regulator [Chloroflexota bacterium]